MSTVSVYRIQFVSNGKYYELYAKNVSQGSLFGFIEVSDFVFNSNSTVVVDPSEEKLKIEFADVESSFIPMHNVLRIDRVSKPGAVKLTDVSDKVHPFPNAIYTRNPD
ncbi:DUF1820 family protein [Celerinatantimonas yamalensis]|uniref:DUF1820 family protein n=1 Tax=Celerinatantimonas yamalensis TaxID=559956 RepID=A0ABW9GB54_9GAMM